MSATLTAAEVVIHRDEAQHVKCLRATLVRCNYGTDGYLLADDGGCQYAVTKLATGEHYTVGTRVAKSGLREASSCTCPGARYNRGRACRHQKVVNEYLRQW